MKNSSLAILGALGLAGAAGVYLAMQDPAEEEVEDLKSQGVDGSGGGVITKGERCAELNTAIPALESSIAEVEAELSDFESTARDIAKQYRSEIYGGSRRKNGQREEEMFQHIMTGSAIVIGPDKGKTPSKATQKAIEDARNKVKNLESEIESMETSLQALKDEKTGYLSEGACIS